MRTRPVDNRWTSLLFGFRLRKPSGGSVSDGWVLVFGWQYLLCKYTSQGRLAYPKAVGGRFR